MKDTQHFLLTRFNVTDKLKSTPGLEVEWLNHRFDLFEQYCLPSVAKQRSLNFSWLVHFDARTNSAMLDRFKELVAGLPVVVVLVDPSGPIRRELACRAISEQLLPATKWVLTSRIDNDDAIADDYMLRVQQELSGKTAAFATFSNGYEWGRGRLYTRHYPLSPFVSRIEPVEDFRSVWEARHRRVTSFGEWYKIDGPPAWIQVVHGENLSNVVRGRRTLRAKVEVGGHFPSNICGVCSQENRLLVMIDRWNPFSQIGRRIKETWLRHAKRRRDRHAVK
jgi:hypothetical protein